MISNNSPSDIKGNIVAPIIVILQVLALIVAFVPILAGSAGSDAAGNAMSAAFLVLFFAVPGILFIFISSFYLLFKKGLRRPYRVIAGFNFSVFISVLILFIYKSFAG